MIKSLFFFIACGIALLSIFACFSDKAFIFELLSHFRFHYFWLSALLLITALIFRLRIGACILLAVVIFNGSYILPWYFSEDESINP